MCANARPNTKKNQSLNPTKQTLVGINKIGELPNQRYDSSVLSNLPATYGNFTSKTHSQTSLASFFAPASVWSL